MLTAEDPSNGAHGRHQGVVDMLVMAVTGIEHGKTMCLMPRWRSSFTQPPRRCSLLA